MHLHRWGPWSEPEPVEVLRGGLRYQVWKQNRECAKCGKGQRRKL